MEAQICCESLHKDINLFTIESADQHTETDILYTLKSKQLKFKLYQMKLKHPCSLLLPLILITLLVSLSSANSMTPTTAEVQPNNAKSENSEYHFVFKANSALTQDFIIKVSYPTQFKLVNPTDCSVIIDSVQVNTAQCALSSITRQIVVSQLNNPGIQSEIQIKYKTSTARYSGPFNIVIYLTDLAGTTITGEIYYLTLSIVNSIMNCELTSSSTKTGEDAEFTVTYTPTVEIQENSIVQIQLQPWGPYSKSNFKTTSTSSICSGACTLTIPGTYPYELLQYKSLYSVASSSAPNSLTLQSARNPPSTQTVSFSILVSAFVSQSSTKEYLTCSNSYSVSELNNFNDVNFQTTNKAILGDNSITLFMSLKNPISSTSYLRINPDILSLSYQYSQYNNVPAIPTEFSTNDGSILLGNLVVSTKTSSPNLIVLSNFNLKNPPYSNKPVTISFRTENLVDTTYYGIQEGTVSIVSIASTIQNSKVTLSTYDINTLATYEIQFTIKNRLISSSFIRIIFPSEIAISVSDSTCTLSGISSSCSVKTSTQIQIQINSIVAAGSSLAVSVSKVTNPLTTTETSSFQITTYYEDESSIVDILNTGLTVTAQQVPLGSASITSSSDKVGIISEYTLTIQIKNPLPASFHIEIKIPSSSFNSNNINLQSISVQKPSDPSPTPYPSCTLEKVQQTHFKLPTSCFNENLPALTTLHIVFGKIDNPLSTKASATWSVQTFYNDKLMEYLRSGITIQMKTLADLTNFVMSLANNVVNEVTEYTFEISFLYTHYSGDRVIVQFPEGIILGVGFICTAITTDIDLSCVQTNAQTLQVTFESSSGSSSEYSSLSFKVSKITNNWYSETRKITVKTTTSDSTYYYVEAGEYIVNFASAIIAVTPAKNEKIVLLSTSEISLTLTSPFSLSRVPDNSKLKITVIVPNDLTVKVDSCTLSYPSSSCTESGQTLSITNFDNFPNDIILTFSAQAQFFQKTSSFTVRLQYNNIYIATNSDAIVQRYCTVPCQKCTSTSTQQCLSCLPEPYTTNNILHPAESSCVQICPSTFYLDEVNNECARCNAVKCLNCQGKSDTCTSCPSDKFLFESKCETSCPQTHYADNGFCLSCKSPCKSCTSASSCLTCIQNYFLDVDQKCVITCSQTGYLGVNGICMKCTNNCVTCQQTLSKCTSCDSPNYLLSENTCVRACDSGYFNNEDLKCVPCVSPCSTCKTASICESCVSEYFLYDGQTCTQTCPPGTLPKINLCEPCAEQCATCSETITNCTSCPSPLLYYLNQCLQQCPPLTYPYQKTCTKCIVPCVTCAQSPQVCLSCVDDMYLLNNTCLQQCPNNGYYKDDTSKQCFPCLDNCLECQSMAKCLVCDANYFLFDGVCVEECPKSKPIVQNRECKSCSDECAACEGKPNNCTECAVFYFRYEYTCVKECPLTYYSNSADYICEDGLSNKIIFFPILITAVICIVIALISKIITKVTALPTTIAAFLSPLQLAIWIFLLVLLLEPILQPGIDYLMPYILIGAALGIFFICNIIFFILNRLKIQDDPYCKLWATNSVNYYVMKIIAFVSLVFGCKFFRLSYSRFLNTLALSAAFKHRSNVFTLATIFSILVLCFCEILMVVACWSLIFSKLLKDQIFYTAIECLIITILSAFFSLIDIYKGEDFFEETEFCRTKKYIEKVKDSSFNKLEQGFQISNEEGSVDAQRFVGTSGGKFMFSKRDPDSFKDLYFENANSNNEDEERSEETDFYEQNSGQRINKKKKYSKMINIFGPIQEEEAEYYEQEKHEQEEVMNEVDRIKQQKKKIKTFDSDEENDLDGTKEREDELGLDQPFDDQKSLIGQRKRKKLWNEIITKREQLANKIFNRHPINLAKIEDEKEEQDDNDLNDILEEEQNTIQKRRRKKKKKGQHNKQLEEIYLQRLTERKKKSVKNLFLSEKSMKYDF